MKSNFVNPKREYKTVFLANIKKSVKNSKDTDEDNNTIFYNALRKHWHNVGEWINSNDMYAAGLFDNQSVYACKINEWHKYTDSDEGERYEFSGEPFLDSDFICKDWSQILEVELDTWDLENGDIYVVRIQTGFDIQVVIASVDRKGNIANWYCYNCQI